MVRSRRISSSQDSPDELLVVEGVLLHLQLLEELVQLLVGQLLAQVGHHVPELLHSDGRALGLEDRLHGLKQLVLCLRLLVFTECRDAYLAISARKSEN